jgi:uncharacterized protein (TIGR04551 family)
MRDRLLGLLLAFGATLGVSATSARVHAQEGTEPKSAEDDEATETEEAVKKAEASREDRSPFAKVRASDWFTLSGPAFTLNGYFRVRSELFHNFNLSRRDPSAFDPASGAGTPPLWPRPPDDDYVDTNGTRRSIELCGSNPTELETCKSNVQAGANMRLRLEPGFDISDNLRIRSQIDMLDNVVLGSTPQGYGNVPSAAGGYEVIARGGYYPLGSFAASAWSPQGGVNNVDDAVLVKRVWGEYMSPIGKLAFGRMPWNWGLGMVFNSGDSYDSDWQSTVDRLQFTYAFPDWNLYLSASWDFANEGAVGLPLHTEYDPEVLGSGIYEQNGQQYDLAAKDDLDQWVFTVVHKVDDQLTRYKLSKGLPVANGGAMFVYNKQQLAQESIDPDEGIAIGQPVNQVTDGFVRRGYEALTGDMWLQFLYDKLSFEVEAAIKFGSVENTLRDNDSDYDNLLDPAQDGWKIRRFGIATETEWRAVEDRLRLGFKFGYATGDDDVASLQPLTADNSASSLEPQLTLNRTLSRFDFHPDYRVDLILFRNILTRVSGAYYFRPSVDFDFYRNPDGQRIGASTAVIYSRASQGVQAPGHQNDLGVELNLRLYYQLSPGRLHHDVEKMGGFFTAIDYGLLLPLGGLGYLPGQESAYSAANPSEDPLGIAPAQIARWYLGVMF